MKTPMDFMDNGKVIIKKNIFDSISLPKHYWFLVLVTACLIKYNLDVYWGISLILAVLTLSVQLLVDNSNIIHLLKGKMKNGNSESSSK